MKFNIEKYLVHSSTFIIFSEGFLVNYIIDWRLMYLIILINYIILLKKFSLKINKDVYSILKRMKNSITAIIQRGPNATINNIPPIIRAR